MLSQLTNLCSQVWSDATAVASLRKGRTDTPFYMGIYFCFGFGTLVVMVVRSAAVVMGTIKASRKLHSDLLEKVANSDKMRLFGALADRIEPKNTWRP